MTEKEHWSTGRMRHDGFNGRDFKTKWSTDKTREVKVKKTSVHTTNSCGVKKKKCFHFHRTPE